MRSRNLKPGFFINPDLADRGPYAMLLFEGLWCMADRVGRLPDEPRRIKALILPYFDVDVDKLLNSLNGTNPKKDFIFRYEVDGEKYIQVWNFKSHQNPHCKEPASSIPAPVKHSTSTVQAPDENGSSTEVAVLIPDSLSLDSGFLIPDSLSLDSGFPIKDHPDHDNAPEEVSDEEIPEDDPPIPEPPQRTEIFSAFEQEFCRLLSPFEIEQITQWEVDHQQELILEALRRSVLNGKHNFKYINSILMEWSKNNIRTVQAIQAYDAEFERRKTKGHARAPDKPADPGREKRREIMRGIVL
jgi:DnaD/phage-associated family protein